MTDAETMHRRRVDAQGVADYLGMSRSFVEKDRTTRKILPFIRIGRKVIYDLDLIDQALTAYAQGGPSLRAVTSRVQRRRAA
ncbi:MAG: excisionase [Pseudomonadota bacterium]